MSFTLGEVARTLGRRPFLTVCETSGASLPDAKAVSGLCESAPIAEPASEKGVPGLDRVIGNEAGGKDEQTSSSPASWEGEAWASIAVKGAAIDSRELAPGALFFCLPGERTDGHDFALDAARAGASGIIALRNPFLNGTGKTAAASGMIFPPVFLVDDVREALWRLAVRHRQAASATVVGITGTAGKTSVKETLAKVLESRGRTERNPKNFNNQIGLPLSMLNASADAAFWVMEAGISEAHDMDELGHILRPDIALILNVGQGHVQGLGGLGVAACKARLLDYVRPGGMALISADYPELDVEVAAREEDLRQQGVTVLRFSYLRHDAFCRAEYEGPTHDSSGRYWVAVRGGEHMLETPFRCEYGSENTAAIVAVATLLGLSMSEIRKGLAGVELPGQRFARKRLKNFTLVDDSYNSNPLSARRMIRAARSMAWEYGLPLFLVMGEMLELGDASSEAHVQLGRAIAEAKPETVFWKGGQAGTVRQGLQQGQFAGSFYAVDSEESFRMLLEEINPVKALVLFKGSRGNRMESLLAEFEKWIGAESAGKDNEENAHAV